MTIKLNRRAAGHARELLVKRRIVRDDRDAWSEHQPSAEKANEFIRRHGFAEYGRWHLGIDVDQPENTKQRYKFPYGDFQRLHRCAVLSAESRAGQYSYDDIQRAAARLHMMLDGVKHDPVRARALAARTAGRRQRPTRRSVSR
jgi:hypothetical protein